ncbi:MAG: bifunctional DNA-formamidopyrimidine glycosylase/DNA-(apurinic or apyrimidinic site) lyase [Planctomycetes bacterium]|nr:bifunctional DNA-formamidopyrimidine glycosylase/DNA-(apurinic or apyrimidinic site) lyase [Planctomycetota bacterium]
MPELPEVENIAMGLRQSILGMPIDKVACFSPVIIKGTLSKQWQSFLATFTGRSITSVTRRAKRLILATADQRAMVFQLGMTGKFLLKDGSAERHKHTHLVFAFPGDRELHYVDTRRFGRLWLFNSLDPEHPDAAMEAQGMGSLGPEPLRLTSKRFHALLDSQRSIKTLLLDQTRLTGLGNIYADESLFASGIHPARSSSRLSADEAVALLRQIKSVLRRAIRAGGTTFSDFENAYGDMGRFRGRLNVYGRQGQPCKICGSLIERIVLNGRGTHICPQCQPQG